MKWKALVPLLFVAAALFTAGCIGNTGSVRPDTDEDNRSGTDEIGDEDGIPGFQRNNDNAGTNPDTTSGISTKRGSSTNTTNTTSNNTGTATEENCTPEGVCGTAQPLSSYSTPASE